MAANAGLRGRLQALYEGESRRATRFRYALIGFDLLTIAFFIVTTPLGLTTGVVVADLAIGAAILAELLARLWIAPRPLKMLRQIHTLIDIVVVASLLLAPILTESLAFLRVLRTLRLLRSYRVLHDLRSEAPFFRRNEDVIVSAVNLGVFVFLVTAVVFVMQHGRNAQIATYTDALYFTVTALTTTGFGDIILEGDAGRLLTVFIMVFGVALFLRLAQTMFRPQKVRFACPTCGLTRHDPDAVHCKHCGRTIRIETEGED